MDHPPSRGGGTGYGRLLTELETQAAQQVRTGQSETNSALREAITMYRAAGYREVPPVSNEAHAHLVVREDHRALTAFPPG